MSILAYSTAYQGGQTFGRILLFVALGAGALKCWSISRRATTNLKCAYGLMFLLLALESIAVGQAVSGNKTFLPLMGLLLLVGFGLFIASIVLSIIGLVEYTQVPGLYRQGRIQAISALVSCGLFFLVVFSAAIGKAMRMSLPNQPLAGAPLTFQEYNFRIRAPGRPWVQSDAARINPDARVAFIRARPELYFMVIAEKSAVADLSSDGLAEFAQGRMKSMAESVQVIERSQRKVGGLSAVRVISNVEISGKSIRYIQTFCATNGWAYQLVAWGRKGDAPLIDAEVLELTDTFELLDPQRLSPVAARRSAVDFLSTNYQFAVACSGPGWLNWADQEKDCPYATFGVIHQQDGGIVVSALNLLGLECDPEAIYRGLPIAASRSLTETELARAQRVQRGSLEGIEVGFERSISSGKPFTYRFQMLRGSNVAYLVAAWIPSERAQKQQFLADALSRVHFLDGPLQPPPIDQMTASEKRVERMMLNGVGMAYYEQHRFDRSARFFKQAVELDNFEHETPYLANYVDACLHTGNYQDALSELETHQNVVESQANLKAREAFLQARAGQLRLAITNYAKLFSSGYTSEEDFRDYVQVLSQTDQKDRALKETENYASRHDSPAVRLLQAGLLKNQERFKEAMELLKAQRQKSPFHAGIIYSLGDCYIASGKPSEALALCDQALKEQGSSAAFLILKGRAEMALKWYRDAKKSFEQALKDAPNDQDIKNWLSIASGVLGEGANSAVKDSVEPVSLPAELQVELPSPPAEFGAEDGAYYSRRISAVSFTRGKEMKTTDYVTIHPLNAEGVSSFSTFQIGYHPLSEQLYVNELKVRDGSGAVVSEGHPDDYYLLDDTSSGMATGRKLLNIPIAGLQPGYRIEAVFTRREFGLAKEFSFLALTLSRPFPVQESVVYLSGDTNAVRWSSFPLIAPVPLKEGLCWRFKEPAVVRWEPLLPPVTDYAPTLWLGDASTKWPELVSEYLNNLRPRLELPPNFTALAKQLTQGTTNEEQKVAAVASYVQTNYTYKAIEFGRRARDPQPLEQIVRNKYGDCKDHAVLTQQLLQAAGVPASLALVSFGSSVREELPSLDQFNHMIVYVPAPHERFIDCTSKSADLTAEWTLGLAGQTVLVLDKESPRFIRIPAYPTNATIVRLNRSIQFTNQLESLVAETLEFEGVHAAFLRSYLRGQSAAGRRAYVASQLLSPSGELLDLAISALDDPLAPLTFKIESLVRGQFELLGNQLAGSPVLGMERTFFEAHPVEKRHAPFETTVPLRLERTISISLPTGFKPSGNATPNGKVQNEFISSDTSVELLSTGWRVASVLYEPRQRRGPEEYNNYRAALREAVESLRPRLVAERAAP